MFSFSFWQWPLKLDRRNFPGGPVAKTPCSQYRGLVQSLVKELGFPYITTKAVQPGNKINTFKKQNWTEECRVPRCFEYSLLYCVLTHRKLGKGCGTGIRGEKNKWNIPRTNLTINLLISQTFGGRGLRVLRFYWTRPFKRHSFMESSRPSPKAAVTQQALGETVWSLPSVGPGAGTARCYVVWCEGVTGKRSLLSV